MNAVFSLFSGIGGLDHGLAQAGWEHVGFCESNGYRRDVLRARFPGVPVWDDVRGVGVQPAQDADGGRDGAGGVRGASRGRRAARPGGQQGAADCANPGVAIYDDVRDIHPGYEATRNAGRGEGRRTLGALGRDAAADPARTGVCRSRAGSPDLLCGGFPCQDLSVAGQRRGLAGDRSSLFFEYARIADAFRPRWLLVENVPGLLSSNGGRDFGIVLGTLADLGYGLGWRILDSRFFGVPQRRRRVFIVGARADGDPAAAAERAGEVLAVGSRCPRHPATRREAREDLAGTLGGGAGSRGWAQDVERMTFVSENQRGEVLETSSTITASYGTKWNGNAGAFSGGNFAPIDGASVRRLMPVECERLQALPDNWTDLGGTPDSKRYAALGDAVTASVAEWIGRRMIAA